MDNYDDMGTVELRRLVRERGLANGGAVASARKDDLIALLRDGTPLASQSLPPAPAAGGDLADIIANAVAGRVKVGVDADQVRDLVDDAITPKLAAIDARIAELSRPVIHEIHLPGQEQIKIEEHTHQCFEKVLKLVSIGLPVLLVGPAGTGKTTLAGQVARALGRRFSFNSLSAGCSESHIIGRTLPDSNGNWTYKPAPFVTTYRDGGVHLFDELDAADPNLMVLINAALANGHLAIPFEDMIIQRHSDTAIIAAANTFGTGASRQYVGRNALDAATLDRFAASTVFVDYDRELEKQLVPNPEWLSRCWSIREKVAEAGLRRIMSTRTILNGYRRILSGDTADAVIADYLASWSDDEKARVK